jgi:hypothetical protein
MVSIQYQVTDSHRDAFLEAMTAMRRSRLRSGASRWELYRVGENSHGYVEQFEVPSWEEHERQHEGRLTAEDKAIEDAAFAHVIGSPQTQHLLPAAANVFEEWHARGW